MTVRQFFYQRQKSVFSATSVLIVTILASRILGLVRDRILTTFLPVDSLGIYFAAFRLPDFLFQVLILGTLSSALIPVFSAYLKRGDQKNAWLVASSLVNAAAAAFLILAALVFVFVRPLSAAVAPGFSAEQANLMAKLTRLLLAAQFFFVLSSFVTGILESYQRFLLPAVAPLFYNLGIILTTFFLADTLGIYAPTLGAVLGAFFHLAVQLPLLFNLGFRFSWVVNFSHPGVKKTVRLMLPPTLAVLVRQATHTADVILASLLSSRSIAFLNFADHLQMLPVGLFGVAVSKAALPALSRQSGSLTDFKRTFLNCLHQIFLLTIPTSVALLVLRIPAVRLVFGARRFTWEATASTGYTLAFFCLSIFAQSALFLVNRAFYALNNTVTPLKAAAASVAVNVFLSVFFVLGLRLPVWSLALSFSLAAVFNFFLLLYLLDRRVGGFDRAKLSRPFAKIGFCSLVSGGAMYVLMKLFDRSAWDQSLSFLGRLTMPERFEAFVLDTRYTVNLLLLTIAVGLVGATVYLFLLRLLKVEEAETLWRALKKLKPR